MKFRILNIQNPGYQRFAISDPISTTSLAFEVALHPTTLPINSQSVQAAWENLQWWESPWQAEIGILRLLKEPFAHIPQPHENLNDPFILTPTRMFYPNALRSNQIEQVKLAATYISSCVRRAREVFFAASSANITELSKPILYFYSALALALAQAATTALFGVVSNASAGGHGLVSNLDEGATSQNWPTIIKWQEKGEFVNLYPACRWDVF